MNHYRVSGGGPIALDSLFPPARKYATAYRYVDNNNNNNNTIMAAARYLSSVSLNRLAGRPVSGGVPLLCNPRTDALVAHTNPSGFVDGMRSAERSKLVR